MQKLLSTIMPAVAVCILTLIQGVSVFAADQVSAAPDSVDGARFSSSVLPLLQTHCFRCHGKAGPDGLIRLEGLSIDLVKDRAAAEHWHEVRNALHRGSMPPADEAILLEADRETIVNWIDSEIKRTSNLLRDRTGRVVMRRLNRAEYHHTMTDLLGLELDYARDLPPDAISEDGFRNDGQSLQMSPILLEYYLETARRALDRVIVSGPAPEVYRHEFTASNVKQWLGKPHYANRLGRQQQFLAKIEKDYPEQGDFLVRVKLTAELKPNVGFPLLEVSVGYRPDTKILFREFPVVEITSSEEQTFEFRGRIEDFPLPVRGQGKYPGLVIQVRNVYDNGSPLPKGDDDKEKGMSFPEEPELPTLVIQSVEFVGPWFDQWPPERHRRILLSTDNQVAAADELVAVAEQQVASESDKLAQAEDALAFRVLQRFVPLAYRRRVEAAEIDSLVAFFRSLRQDYPSFEDAMRETLAMVLISPDFLFMVEPLVETAGNQRRQLDDWELASRLSYFLWSTMPDEPLRDLAAADKLNDPSVLSAQIERMLADPRSSRLINQFTEQWLHLDVVDRVAISRDYHPKFDDRLKSEMRGETEAFLGELVRSDENALNLLSSSFTMLNEPLARHYSIEGVYGQSFRRFELTPDQHRGGLLGHASILLSNSTGDDSHPVRRAVWIRDRLLNDPPAPPPADVPSLEAADPEFHKLSIREQLIVHRKKEACNSCHQNIDPWGIALENFDAVGLWRDKIRRKVGKGFETRAVVASDVLPGGVELSSVEALKDHLINHRKMDFANSLVTRLLTYALGRRLELSDQEAIDQLTAQFAADDYPMRRLIHQVVSSSPFQTK